MGSWALAYLAGAITIVNPCVLPVLPLIFTSALNEGKYAPLALIAGLVLSFVVVGTSIAAIGFGAGFDPLIIRTIAAFAFIALGSVMLVGTLQQRFALAMGPLSAAAGDFMHRAAPTGLGGQFAIGALLGVVWSPCTGPTLGAAIVLAGNSGGFLPAMATMTAFGLGTGTVLVCLAYGTREIMRRRGAALAQIGQRAKPVLGLVLITLGIAVLAGLDKKLEASLVDLMPDWLLIFTTSI